MIKWGEEGSPTTYPLGAELGCWCLKAAGDEQGEQEKGILGKRN